MHFAETLPRTFGKTVFAADLKISKTTITVAQEGAGGRRGSGGEVVTDACTTSSECRHNF